MAEPDGVAVRAATGSAVLSVGSFAYAAISAVGSIVVARLLGPVGYGAVSMALIYPMMFSGLAERALLHLFVRPRPRQLIVVVCAGGFGLKLVG
jgi:hypothetical protein